MHIRMAERVTTADAALVADVDHTCRWCGFRCVGGMTAYEDDDGPSCACTVCLAARHAGDLTDGFGFAWMPEVSQIDLAHFYRVMAVARFVPSILAVPNVSPRAPRQIPFNEENVDLMLRTLAQRRRLLFDMTRPIGGVQDAVAEMDGETKDAFMAGLRVVPVEFDGAEIDRWLDGDSSLAGYGRQVLDRNGWFRRSDHLVAPEPEATSDTDDKDEDEPAISFGAYKTMREDA